ncbi:YjbH domain-containing protein [candidate division KSB1 bacterium]|nr:YjbH domain-containing protein [candidate division KSB1 bacterium]
MRTTLFIVSIYLLFSSQTVLCDICTSGTSSLINIPVARVIPHEKVAIGISYVHHRVAYLAHGQFDNYPIYMSLGYLPRIEISAGVVFVPGEPSYDGTHTYKDGVISFQVLALKEHRYLPAIAIGARDIYSFILLNTSYLVASKTVVQNPTVQLLLHTGYGSDVINEHQGVPKHDKQHPVGHTIVGLFGGLELNVRPIGTFVLEFDSKKWNGGVKRQLLPHLAAELTMMQLMYICGGFQFTFHL